MKKSDSDYVFYPDTTWYERALCGDFEQGMFFLENGDHGIEAKLLCQDCPVRGFCLWTAVQNDETDGVWGGLTERERKLIFKLEPEFAKSLSPDALLIRYPVKIHTGRKAS